MYKSLILVVIYGSGTVPAPQGPGFPRSDKIGRPFIFSRQLNSMKPFLLLLRC